MRINQNIAALNAYRNLSITDSRLNRSLERLSSGLRINRAADDAAGLAISEKMRAQIRGLRSALRNAQDGISLIQTAEGAIQEVHSMLQRMRELAVQAANETYTSADRMEIQKEIEQLKMEINRIASATEFNTKRLLDGSSSAIVSTDKITTHVFMRDGLRYVDQFGQKIEGGGNFKIEVQAERIGQAQVQKSNIFMIKHGEHIRNLNFGDTGIIALDADGLQYGDYVVETDQSVAADGKIAEIQKYLQGTADNIFGGSEIQIVGGQEYNASILFEVTAVNPSGGTNGAGEISYRVISHQYAPDGTYKGRFIADLVVDLGAGKTLNIGYITLEVNSNGSISEGDIVVGDKAVYNVRGNTDNADLVKIIYDPDGLKVAHEWAFSRGNLDGKTTSFNFFTLNNEGIAYDGSVQLTFEQLGEDALTGGPNKPATFTYESGTGKLADLNTRLYDIREFWDKNGRFLLESPQTVTIVQGDGTQTFFTLDMNDTLGSLRDKINRAIGAIDPKYLGQGRYVSPEMMEHFATYVSEGTGKPGTHTSTEGTMVVRSVIPGRQGELAFFGNADIINALGFQTIQRSSETIFNIKVTNAHDNNEIIADNVQISSNLLVGVVHPYVDVEFDPLAGMGTVTELDDNGAFKLEVAAEPHVTYIHLKDSTLIFQIGPNPGQDVGAAIGRLDSRALGIHGILVTDRIKANQAIDAIDRAMGLVSAERSKLGAVQNRLEHTANSLSVTIENLTASESRIRDLDLAEEMVEFTRNQILLQAGTAMLAQANMKPQAIMQLLG